MERFTLKKYLNRKVYTVASLRFSKKFERKDQSEVDEIIKNFDKNEQTFKDLEEVKVFLANNKKSVLAPPPERRPIKIKKEASTNKIIYVFWAIAFLLVFLWKYFRDYLQSYFMKYLN